MKTIKMLKEVSNENNILKEQNEQMRNRVEELNTELISLKQYVGTYYIKKPVELSDDIQKLESYLNDVHKKTEPSLNIQAIDRSKEIDKLEKLLAPSRDAI